MFKKVTFALILTFCFVLFNAAITPPQPAYAYGVIGEPCSVSWIDYTIDPLGVIVDNTWIDECPMNCYGVLAGDTHDRDLSKIWCVEATPPPNLPGIDAGAYCSASTSRTVTLMTAGTLGTRFEIEGPSGVVEATSFVFTDLPEGENRFRARAHNDGGSSEWTEWVSVYHDYSPPNTTAHFVGLVGMNDWYISPVSTTFNMTDNGCFGVSATTYMLNGTTNTYTGSPFNILNEGFNTLAFSSTDGHHPENQHSATIQIDTLAPTVSISPDRPFDVSSGWWTAPFTVTIHADDATSGISSLEYNLNGGGWASGNSLTLSADGVYELDVQATDNAGHLSYNGVILPIDTSAPVLDVQITGEQGENNWFITPPTVTLSATDATSGVIGVLYQLENETQTIYTAPLTFVREGLYTLQAFAVDEAQHITARTVQIGYDITPPQTHITLTESENGMVITLNRWDGVSGFALTRMAINGVWVDYHHPVTVTDIGEYWVQFYTIDFAGNIEAEKIAQFVIREDSIETVIIPPVVVNEPPQNDNTPPFETRDDFPPDLHDENVYFQLPPMVIPPFETADDFPPDLHDEGVYFTYPEDNRVPDGAGLPIQTALTGDNAGHGSADMGIKRNPRPIVDVAEAPNHSSAPESIPTATAPIPASNPLNGVLVTLATLGVITASAGALTMTSTALAKKKEQDEAKAAQLAHLQAEQALQAETAQANWDENQQKQAQASTTVVMAGKQSQANKNFWYAYVLWQQKVAQALARRRAEALARKRAEAEAQSNQLFAMTNSMRVMFFVALGISLLMLSFRPAQNTKPKDEAYLRPYDDVEQSCGLLYPSDTMDTIRCSVGAALKLTANYVAYQFSNYIVENFDHIGCWAFAIDCPWYDLGIESYANSNTLPHAQAQPLTIPQATAVAVPTENAIPIPFTIPYERQPDPEDNDKIWFHYTDQAGINEIALSGIIRANTRGIVYVTQQMYSAEEAFYALFAGNPSYIGKGEYYVAFVAQDGVTFYPAGDLNAPQATQNNERIHYGSLRPFVEIKYYVYIGPNPF